MRHNDSVAHSEDGMLHFNALVFQQQDFCDLSTRNITGGDSLRQFTSVSAVLLGSRAWVYWLQRASTLLEPEPTGLYNPGVYLWWIKTRGALSICWH